MHTDWKLFSVSWRVFTFALLVAASVPFVYAAYDTDGMVGYWKFDETSGSTALDVSGHNNHLTYNGSPTVSTAVPTTSFTNARSLSYDGSDYLSQTTLSSQPTSNLSICVWINTNSASTAQYIASLNRSVSNFEDEFVLQLSGSKLSFWDFTSLDYGFHEDEESSGVLSSDTWHHVCFTKNGTAGIYYIDGAQSGTKTAGANVSYGASDFYIGRDIRDADKQFDGEIDELRLYNRTLTSAEIAELAAGNHMTAIWDGSSSHDFETAANWDINVIPDPYTHLIVPEKVGGVVLSKPASGASLTIEASGFTGSYIDLHGFDFEFTDSGELKGGGILKLLGSETINTTTIGTTSTGTVLYYGTGTYTGLSAGDSYYNLNINDGLVGYWDFDVNEGGLVPDVSGHDHDGARAYTPNSPGFSTDVPPTAFFNRNALSFDGNDYVHIKPDVFDALYRSGNGGFTFSLWQKSDASANSGDNDQMLIGVEGGYNNGWSMYYDANDTHPSVNFTSDFSNRVEATGYTTYDGGWHHIAVTYINGTVRIFIDGVAAASGTQTLYDITSENTETRIGYAVDNANYFPGLIDDIRVYNRPLEDHEISALAAGHVPATASGSFTLDASVDIDHNLALESGLVDVSGSDYQITVGGSWLNYGGQLNPRDGIVRLDSGTSDEEIRSGGQAFTNVSITGAGSWDIRDLLDVDGYINLTGGNVDATTDNYSVHAYDFDQSSDNFVPRSGVVVLNGSSDVSSTIVSTLNELQIEDPTEDGLVGYWKFDECQGDTTADSSGTGNNGTLVGPPLWTGSSLTSTIVFDNSCGLNYDGTGRYVDIPDDNTLDLGTEFTFAGWAKFDDFDETYSFIISKDGVTSATDDSYDFGVHTAMPYVAINDGSWQEYRTDSTLSTDTWYH